MGKTKISRNIRAKIIEETIKNFKYERLIHTKSDYIQSMDKIVKFGKDLFKKNDDIWDNVRFSF